MSLKTQFLSALAEFERMDIENLPSFKLMEALATDNRAAYPNREIIASKIKIKVSREFINDPDLVYRTVQVYVGILNKAWHILREKHGYTDALQMLEAQAERMEITYE